MVVAAALPAMRIAQSHGEEDFGDGDGLLYVQFRLGSWVLVCAYFSIVISGTIVIMHTPFTIDCAFSVFKPRDEGTVPPPAGPPTAGC